MNTPHIGPLVRQLSVAIGRQVDSGKGLGISRTQCRIMGYLAHHSQEPVFQKDIEAVLHISKSTASQLISSLEEKGLLLRESVPDDARLKSLTLTNLAKAHSSEVEASILQVEQLMRRGISQEELDSFFSTIDKIMHNLRSTPQAAESIPED